MKIKDIVIEAIKGFFIGVAILIPGISAGTIALITKLYRKIINSLSNIFKSFWPSLKSLIPIGIGVMIAIVSMWIPLKLATTHILFAIMCLFAGSMIGSLPDVTSKIKKENVKKHHLIYFVVAILLAVSLGILSYHLNFDVSKLFDLNDYKIYLIIIPVGMLGSAGIVVPGISGSMLLLVTGFYKSILDLENKMGTQPGLVILLLVCMAIGVILGMICLSRLMKRLFNKYETATYIWIIGLVIGSIFSLFYNHDSMHYYFEHGISWWEAILGVILLIIGFIVSYSLFIYQRKQKRTE